MIQCLIVLFLNCGISAAGQCEKGNWVTQAPWEQPYHSHYARTGYVINESYSFELFHSRSCPTQPLFYSCYYRDSKRLSLRNLSIENGLHEHAKSAENTVWVPSNQEQCLQLYPRDFLRILFNRTLLVYGDSVSTSVFGTLICSLYKTIPFSEKKWYSYSPYLAFADGHLYIKQAKLRLVQRYVSKFHVNHFKSTIINLDLQTNDIIFLNIGLHYNDEVVYRSTLRDAFYVFAQLNLTRAYLPQILFLATTPQHFETSAGYVNQTILESLKLKRAEKDKSLKLNRTKKDEISGNHTKSWHECGIENQSILTNSQIIEKMKEGDWRNMIARQEIETYNKVSQFHRVHFVSYAEPLYLQSQAHIGEGDCTHYCIPSGVFPMIHRFIFNKLIDILQLRLEFTYASKQSVLNYKNNTIVRGVNSRTVYLVRDNLRFSFLSKESFLRSGFTFDMVQILDEDMLEDIPLVGSA